MSEELNMEAQKSGSKIFREKEVHSFTSLEFSPGIIHSSSEPAKTTGTCRLSRPVSVQLYWNCIVAIIMKTWL